MRGIQSLVAAAFAAAIGVAWVADAAGQELPGVSAGEIRIGNTMPYTGPAAAYGAVGRTLEAYFAMVNANGGINGRRVEFITYDDGFSPPRTFEQVRRLVEQDDVLLIFQSLGTGPNLAIRDYLNAAGVPQLFASTGSPLLADPAAYPWTMRLNPSFEAEATVYGRYIGGAYPGAKVGVLYSNDEAGAGYVAALTAALPAGTPVVALPYDVTDTTVDAQIGEFRAQGVEVFANFAIGRPAALAIQRAAEIGWQPRQILASTSASAEILGAAGAANAIGIVSAIFLKDPGVAEWADDPDVVAFQAFMRAYYPDGRENGLFELAAYTAACALVAILERAGDDLSRAHIMDLATHLEGVSVPGLVPGIVLDTGPTDYEPLEQFQLVQFDGTAFVPFGPVIDGAE